MLKKDPGSRRGLRLGPMKEPDVRLTFEPLQEVTPFPGLALGAGLDLHCYPGLYTRLYVRN